jgi:nitroimidazol reductase NimA-like FMN-containing flavoprotein (pyridoxamine 5'-phosphate oxidase superfamily)
MRRKDREIVDMNEILGIIKKCDVCSLAFFDKEYPYIIPLNFGYHNHDDKIELYFHCAGVGKKLDLMKANPNVAFEMNCSRNLITGENACDYTMEFESVCGNGVAVILPEEEKITALNYLMKQYSNKENFQYNENLVKRITVLKLTVHNISGKRLVRSN